MEKPVKLGLIGKNISYSFSQKHFEDKFKKFMLTAYTYDLFDLQQIDEVSGLLKDDAVRGFNVTIPYKEQIIPFLDELSDEAGKIGAVNTVKIFADGRKKGFNTDAFGFEKTLLAHRKEHHTSALILGDGGAAKAVKYVLDKYHIAHQTISRKSDLNFENLTPEVVRGHTLIIQTTPVGTFPNVEDCLLFPFEGLSEQHLIIDLIYNPNYTKFIKNAAEKGAKTVNGYYMLEQQAEKAWEIWNLD
ncbi:shikimate dehydrogenase [Elizabethkingia meningoseptica]|uniref:shikimate dehydrogenase family protein n=1 Tax=Elizabethkingia meningoseptica TaxID=238 RepID=UPI000332CEFC|nr:shikimate dehydrogenase [Elizabethkingia meningoseptica]AQX05188.1 shikimate dehydrogenase [Elizabethkingia meningoseptica]AQX47233.1 shikimate dehydrogenase [Elizabethkingia meningoseptica]EOR29119.1 shikimate 5-dehydrogenase [Elizabethkingia meningoseptica ATCC 13253 = NBRC 12535]KUY16873.1 shikimate dehydrogenase [Elizabethkingia meningoseptica]OPB68518.1 shikimate dehydrogenase [Elizabethkingia meningoseptica]